MSPTPAIDENVVTGDPYPNYYETAYAQLISSYGDLVKKVMDQNLKLEEQMADYDNQHSTDYQKSVYEIESIDQLKKIYGTMFYVFYAFVGITILYGLYKGVFSLKTPAYLIAVIFLLIFPFVVYSLEEIGYSIIKYVWDLVNENVYSNVFLQGDY